MDRVTVRCGACGSDQFKGVNSSTKDSDVITCAGCGAQGRYGDVRRDAMEQTKKALDDKVKKAFKGIKGITWSK